MISLFLKLLIAHAVGDFMFQPSHWVKDKVEKKHASKYLFYHVLVHVGALLVMLQFDLRSYWLGILLIFVTHYLIDIAKLHLDDKKNSKFYFLADQIAHLLMIIIVVYLYEPFIIDWSLFYSESILLFALALILVTSVSSIVMMIIMSKWVVEDDVNGSLKEAGKYIGLLERLFVFGFIVLGQWQGVGFLLAAKSVFRFGDLSKAKDRKLTEYILIGTLLSFGLAILIGIGYTYCAQKINS